MPPVEQASPSELLEGNTGNECRRMIFQASKAHQAREGRKDGWKSKHTRLKKSHWKIGPSSEIEGGDFTG